ncbi:hypothetical protein HYFRA_00008550 [Hymenoscyphus fraxineus]|uniref:Uncharacterized protein n=1 Tax=Hymenoscyphus fraxineus TaxID=746836 RepID=A0A9N9KWQ9_9HELO|nr:hypothetical protein HYFRA_00008550 [Hymenoscyphus fraxineus]
MAQPRPPESYDGNRGGFGSCETTDHKFRIFQLDSNSAPIPIVRKLHRNGEWGTDPIDRVGIPRPNQKIEAIMHMQRNAT